MIKIIKAPDDLTPEAAGLPEDCQALYIPHSTGGIIYPDRVEARVTIRYEESLVSGYKVENRPFIDQIADYLAGFSPDLDVAIYDPTPSMECAELFGTGGVPSMAWMFKQMHRSNLMALWLDHHPSGHIMFQLATWLTMGKKLIVGLAEGNHDYGTEISPLCPDLVLTDTKDGFIKAIAAALVTAAGDLPTGERSRERGLFTKFTVYRRDGRDGHGRNREPVSDRQLGIGGYIVLDVGHDPLAYPAARVYAREAAHDGYSDLSRDINILLDEHGRP